VYTAYMRARQLGGGLITVLLGCNASRGSEARCDRSWRRAAIHDIVATLQCSSGAGVQQLEAIAR
jgi:hypothetical protein